jgi:ribosomal protein S18 acetylase RimI-like enzyme
VTARDATLDDVEELIRLRRLMFESMGVEAGGPWQDQCRGHLRERLGTRAFAAVVDRPAGAGLAASGIVEIQDRIPSPFVGDGRIGYLGSMSTDIDCRGRGYGRAVLALLVQRSREAGLEVVDLHYTADGERMYRELGFRERDQGELRLTLSS